MLELDENELILEKRMISESRDYGNIGDAGLVLRNIRKNLNKELTEDIIREMFSNTYVSYYFKDSKNRKDFYIGSEESLFSSKRIPLCKFVKLSNIPEMIHQYQYLLFFYTENIPDSNKLYEWRPCYVGGKDFLFNKFLPQIDNAFFSQSRPINITESTIKHIETNEYSHTRFLDTIYENLFNKEKWKNEEDVNKLYFNRLNRYLNYLTSAISKKISSETLDEKYYCKTVKDGSDYILINSRLLNKFGSWIYLSYKIRKSYSREAGKVIEEYLSPQIVNNYQSAYDSGYTDISLNDVKPVQFYNDSNDLLFKGDIDSFDLDDSQHFQHMLEDRQNRLPESLREKNVMELATRFKSSIEYALKMKEMDYNYIVPSYGIERDCIQFLIPFYDEFAPDKIPSGVIVTNKIGKKWVLNTILNLSDAYDVARLLAIPATNWI